MNTAGFLFRKKLDSKSAVLCNKNLTVYTSQKTFKKTTCSSEFVFPAWQNRRCHSIDELMYTKPRQPDKHWPPTSGRAKYKTTKGSCQLPFSKHYKLRVTVQLTDFNCDPMLSTLIFPLWFQVLSILCYETLAVQQTSWITWPIATRLHCSQKEIHWELSDT